MLAYSLNGISIDGLLPSNCYSLSGTAACGQFDRPDMKLEQFNEKLPKSQSKPYLEELAKYLKQTTEQRIRESHIRVGGSPYLMG